MDANNPNPLALMCDAPVESIDELSSWDLRIDQFSRLRIGENFNISVLDFLNLPRRLITKLISSAEALETLELKKRKEVENKLKNEIEGYQNVMPGGFNHTVAKIK